MKKLRLLLSALVFSASGWANASVPIIQLPESNRMDVNFYSHVSLNNTFSGVRDNSSSVGGSAGNGMRDPQFRSASFLTSNVFSDILTQAESMSTLTDHQVNEGSFSSYARVGPSSFGASDSNVGAGNIELRYGALVASSPALKIWTVLLLAVGCVVYQGRHRQRPFGYRKLH
ncbi:MAG: hypothetical protein HHJ09_16740 [Glaciimonas sp.]|nr:hypothetical protein [Glaciimonas sp.]